MMNCNEATAFIEKSEFEPLSIILKIKLSIHLLLCKLCRIYKNQSVALNVILKKNEQEKFLSLSLEKKEAISHLLNEIK